MDGPCVPVPRTLSLCNSVGNRYRTRECSVINFQGAAGIVGVVGNKWRVSVDKSVSDEGEMGQIQI